MALKDPLVLYTKTELIAEILRLRGDHIATDIDPSMAEAHPLGVTAAAS